MNPALLLTVGSFNKRLLSLVLGALAVIIALPMLAVFSLGTSALSFLSNAPSAEAAATQGFYMGGPIPGNGYAWGNCTYWTFAQRLWVNKPIPVTWGNANTWDDNAKKDHYEVNHTPRVTAIFQTDGGDLGHVAYVTEVNPETGQWTISEMNVKGLNIVSTRTFSKDAAAHYNFIHDKEVP
jgi:surface antigen